MMHDILFVGEIDDLINQHKPIKLDAAKKEASRIIKSKVSKNGRWFKVLNFDQKPVFFKMDDLNDYIREDMKRKNPNLVKNEDDLMKTRSCCQKLSNLTLKKTANRKLQIKYREIILNSTRDN